MNGFPIKLTIEVQIENESADVPSDSLITEQVASVLRDVAASLDLTTDLRHWSYSAFFLDNTIKRLPT